MKMDENLPRPGGHGQRHKHGNIVPAWAECDQSVDGSSGNSDIKAGPERHDCREGKQRSHRLNIGAGRKISPCEPGKAGGHTAAWAGQSGSQGKLTLVQAQLGVCSHPGRAGNQPDGGNHQPRGRPRKSPAKESGPMRRRQRARPREKWGKSMYSGEPAAVSIAAKYRSRLKNAMVLCPRYVQPSLSRLPRPRREDFGQWSGEFLSYTILANNVSTGLKF